MGIKRVQSLTINLKDGGAISLLGDQAHSAYSRLDSYRNGNLGAQEGFTYVDDQGARQMLRFDCICGFALGPTTEETIPDPTCDPLNCLPD